MQYETLIKDIALSIFYAEERPKSRRFLVYDVAPDYEAASEIFAILDNMQRLRDMLDKLARVEREAAQYPELFQPIIRTTLDEITKMEVL